MNNAQRKELKILIAETNSIKKRLEIVLSNEEQSFDNLSEGLQATARGMSIEEAIDSLNTAIECLDEAIESMEDATL